jgi:NADP-dependent 3-hydroxy acid dehydrogenase YdfG
MLLAKKSGHIVNLGSIAGHAVYPMGSVYCATKFAVNALTEALRMDTLGSGLRVTAVDPGMVETEFSLVRFKGDQAKSDAVYQGVTPLTPDDIADAICWSLSRPKHVNVQQIVLMPTDQASVRDIARR